MYIFYIHSLLLLLSSYYLPETIATIETVINIVGSTFKLCRKLLVITKQIYLDSDSQNLWAASVWFWLSFFCYIHDFNVCHCPDCHCCDNSIVATLKYCQTLTNTTFPFPHTNTGAI